LRVSTKVMPRNTPSVTSRQNSTEKCANANTSAEITMEIGTGRCLQSEGSRNPRKMYCALP